jgi:hypothetical protein
MSRFRMLSNELSRQRVIKMKVYLVAESTFEWYRVRHICGSWETAVKRFEEIRAEMIEDNKQTIEFNEKEGFDSKIWKRKNFLLRNLPVGGKCHCRCDHPDLVEWEVEP